MSPPDRPEGTGDGELHPDATRRRPQSVRVVRHGPAGNGEPAPATASEVAAEASPRATEDVNGPTTGSPPRTAEVPAGTDPAPGRPARPSVIRISRTVDVDLEKEALAR